MNSAFFDKETTLSIAGAAGNIEVKINGITATTGTAEDVRAVAVICHPHPLYGGTFDNKVVSTLARVFRDSGIVAVRFNFRGVGSSDGVHDEGGGERADLASVITWVQQQCEKVELYLAGFSFGGAVVAAYVASLKPGNPVYEQVRQVMLVSPAIGRYGFEADRVMPLPTLLIQGEADELLSVEDACNWAKQSAQPVEVCLLPQTSHFYHGKLVELKQAVLDRLVS